MQFINASNEQEWVYHATSFLSDCLDSHECPLITFPTGNTPTPFYAALRRNQNIIGRDFRFLMLDEYAGLRSGDPRHFTGWLTRELLDPLEVPQTQRHCFDPYAVDIEAECKRFNDHRNDMGPLHLAFLGVGASGHVAMNDPPADAESTTRIIHMPDDTYVANMAYWADFENPLPRTGYSLGIKDLLQSKKIVVLLRQKPELAKRIEQLTKPDPLFPVSLLMQHPHITILNV